MSKVAVIDYGMGNLRSVWQALKHVADPLGVAVEITHDPEVVMAADRVVLPGQGAMPDCMRELKESGLLQAVLHAAQHKPLFGVCVGMQMLLDQSHEGPVGRPTPTLGLMGGEVKRFDLDGKKQADGHPFKVPQMGWNQVRQTQPHALWAGIEDESHFYFVHSYYAQPVSYTHLTLPTILRV